jgi:hypothetical protein
MMFKALAIFFLPPLVFFSLHSNAEQRLWLPKSYQRLMPELLAATKLAEQTDRCDRVLTGGLATYKPGESEVLFRLTCRDADKLTYNLRYAYYPATDELKLVFEQKSKYRLAKEEAMAKKKAEDAARRQAEQEALEKMKAEVIAMAEAEARREAEKVTAASDTLDVDMDILDRAKAMANLPVDEELAWQACLDAIKDQARMMRDIKIHSDPRPASEIVHKVERDFVIDFDARNPQLKPLYYRAFCHVWQDGSSVVKITARNAK